MIYRYTYPPSRMDEDRNTGQGWINDLRVHGTTGSGLDGDIYGGGGYWYLEWESRNMVLDWGYVE